ncbi:hypothetical protein [Sphingomonas sp. Leaf38]|jgi:hypothetical protein|uniref:hypothetical protein n=1 Tax=Sphingomonas sp. Leaf38 TaxID=1736217 RepID=UPI0006F94F4B|nr:hypothetical protein [Sphingomonas sp. Leaf38]KQN27842.1 hypothetical protein ASE88_16135 [Sphingomonas sp. Leaf38]
MKFKALTGGALAAAMMTTSVAASAAPVSNAASSLSVSHARVGSATTGKNKAAGGGLFALLIGAGVVAIGVVAIVKDDNSDSN